VKSIVSPALIFPHKGPHGFCLRPQALFLPFPLQLDPLGHHPCPTTLPCPQTTLGLWLCHSDPMNLWIHTSYTLFTFLIMYHELAN